MIKLHNNIETYIMYIINSIQYACFVLICTGIYYLSRIYNIGLQDSTKAFNSIHWFISTFAQYKDISKHDDMHDNVDM